MIEARKSAGRIDETWRAGNTGTDIFHWWMEDGVLPGQLSMDDLMEDNNV